MVDGNVGFVGEWGESMDFMYRIHLLSCMVMSVGLLGNFWGGVLWAFGVGGVMEGVGVNRGGWMSVAIILVLKWGGILAEGELSVWTGVWEFVVAYFMEGDEEWDMIWSAGNFPIRRRKDLMSFFCFFLE